MEMNDIIGARYWYNKTKQYGYELVSFRMVKFRDEETGQPFYEPYVDVFLQKSELQNKNNYTSIEGYLDEEFFMERWTGIEDTDGEKIYEGDIVEIRGTGTGTIRVAIIRYGKPYPEGDLSDEFYIEERNGNISLNSLDLDEYYGDITVVGNIHEDPELYEETKKRGW